MSRFRGVVESCFESGQCHEVKRGDVFVARRWVVERSFVWAVRLLRSVPKYERAPAPPPEMSAEVASCRGGGLRPLCFRGNSHPTGAERGLRQYFCRGFWRRRPTRWRALVDCLALPAASRKQIGIQENR